MGLAKAVATSIWGMVGITRGYVTDIYLLYMGAYLNLVQRTYINTCVTILVLVTLQ